MIWPVPWTAWFVVVPAAVAATRCTNVNPRVAPAAVLPATTLVAVRVAVLAPCVDAVVTASTSAPSRRAVAWDARPAAHGPTPSANDETASSPVLIAHC